MSSGFWTLRGHQPLSISAKTVLVTTATVVLLWGISAIAAQYQVDVAALSPSTPTKAIELNKRNEGVVHSGPGLPILGKLYRPGITDRN